MRRILFRFAAALFFLLALGALLYLFNWWRIEPYVELEHVKLPPGSTIVEHTIIHRSDSNWPHIYGVRAARCPLPFEDAKVWVQQNNDLAGKNIRILENGAMSSHGDFYYGDAGEGYCYLILLYYKKL